MRPLRIPECLVIEDSGMGHITATGFDGRQDASDAIALADRHGSVVYILRRRPDSVIPVWDIESR